MNIYKENYKEYLDKGYSVIPDKFMKKSFYIKGFKIFISNGHRFRLGYRDDNFSENMYIWFYLGTFQLGIWDRR